MVTIYFKSKTNHRNQYIDPKELAKNGKYVPNAARRWENLVL
jgi:hypothetical protein